MVTLKNAPLVEVIFELRWGNVTRLSGAGVQFNFTEEDTTFFPGQFHSVALEAGFGHTEKINVAELPIGGMQLPHLVTHRYRKASGAWPCYQVGLGIFTVNQVKGGYKWAVFKDAVVDGVALLNKGHPKSLDGLPLIGAEIKYRDFFPFEESGTLDFFNDKLQFGISLPKQFTQNEIIGEFIEASIVSYHLECLSPPAKLLVTINRAEMNKKQGYLMETVVRSADAQVPDVKTIEDWLESAHGAQQHTFETLITPAYARTFE